MAEIDGVSATVEIGYTQPFERWTFTGTAIGQIGFRNNKPAPAGVTPDKAFKKGAYSEVKWPFSDAAPSAAAFCSPPRLIRTEDLIIVSSDF
ncbi:MAG: hypothetical protein FJY97_04175 [candidate division Zixibacteria bacterium]|nr:hypothetical protein [candidate division Zixibacteria bacterium]